MATSIESSNLGRLLSGYGGVSGGNTNLLNLASSLRGTELSNQLTQEQVRASLANQETGLGMAQTELDAKLQQYQDQLLTQALSSGMLSDADYKAVYKQLYGYEPTTQSKRTFSVGFNNSGGSSGNALLNSGTGMTIDTSNPGNILEAANYARSLGELHSMGPGNTGIINRAKLSRDPYYQASQKLVKMI